VPTAVVTGTPTADTDTLLDGLATVRDDCGLAVAQAFDAAHVADRDHLRLAFDLAERERGRGEAIARDREMEVLLYAAGRRQIDRALAMGAREGAPAAVLVAGRESAVERAVPAVQALAAFDAHEVALGDPDRLREFFGVSDAELAAAGGDLAGVVRERVALLVVER
jgi:KEOPS complex subunit Cgi121